jgi:hypothetical protein
MGKARHDAEMPGLDRRLAAPTDERWGRRLTRSRVAPALIAAALGSVLVAAPVAAQVVDDSTTSTTSPDTTLAPVDSTTTTADPFDTTTTVATVEGDSTTTAPVTDFKKAGRVKDVRGDGVNHALATGSKSLIDGNGLKYFINTDITFNTTSSASAAMSEASYTTAVDATTLNGGTTATTLNDAFDGYNTLCVDVSGATGNCSTSSVTQHIYNQLGPASTDCSGRNIVFPTMNIDDGSVSNLDVTRQVYVPLGGDFARWLNTFTNKDAVPVTFQATIANNLGSDSNTISTGSSAGGPVGTGVTWFGSMQNYSGTTSPDVRLGHVLGGAGATTSLDEMNFAAGDDNPYWGWSITVQPGETVSIATFVAGAPSKALANSTAASLAAGGHSGQWGCMTTGQKAAVANFDLAPPPTTTTTTTAPPSTEAPTTAAPAVEATGTLPYTGAGGELLPLAGAGAAAMAAGGAAVAATKRKLRRPRFRHGR